MSEVSGQKLSVYDSELFPPEYVVLRKDRAGDVGWGGVLLAVKSNINVKRITNVDDLTDDKELLFAIVTLKNVKLLVCVVYLPPNYSDKQYLDVLNCIENAVDTFSDYPIVIVGDFNLKSCNVSVQTQFYNFLEYCKLRQCNNICNDYGCILDFALTTLSTQSINVTSDIEPLVPTDAYHPPLEILLSLPVNTVNKIPTSVTPEQFSSLSSEWNFRGADFPGLYSDIADIDWTDLLRERDVDLAVEILYNKLNSVISARVPHKKSNFE
ncbi:hypothetical protein HF086_012085 [Spodoptera exigua]|uniref:Endonuclease/exonuclease/phosphatase domain-containing protein n=1 Tax=Spodoptera exigua TaxID=7107 RepID=A0A922M6B1_SPOEX|nr:hypothetical protein HF086_012085 [Spodoptera exigua]